MATTSCLHHAWELVPDLLLTPHFRDGLSTTKG